MSKKMNLFIGIVVCWSAFIYGWEGEETHPFLTEGAICSSDLDSFVKERLGLSNGVNTVLWCQLPEHYNFEKRMKAAKKDASQIKTVSEWIVAGSVIEDYLVFPDLRFKNHFHDPIRDSGLDNTERWLGLAPDCLFTGDSAQLWAIDGGSGINNHTWHNARISRVGWAKCSGFYSMNSICLSQSFVWNRPPFAGGELMEAGNIL